jgi:glycosyltransferase involved in cell wall biosynthesis
MAHIKEEILPKIDLFIAPSRYLMERFIGDFPIELSKIIYLDYGFLREELTQRKREQEESFTFGYIGTHKQAKGILHLLQAFNQLHSSNAQLKIWGSSIDPFTSSLKTYISSMNPQIQQRIHWMGGYNNDQIVEEVFNHVDAIVVPSIWGENSPLVIHEALEAKVPVITANFGGMKEYIQHDINGLLFEHRSPLDLCMQMQRIIEDPKLRERIAKKGYLQSNDGRIPGIEEHTKQVESYYRLVIERRRTNYAREARPLAHHI